MPGMQRHMLRRSNGVVPVSVGGPSRLSRYSVIAVHSAIRLPSFSSSTGKVAE